MVQLYTVDRQCNLTRQGVDALMRSIFIYTVEYFLKILPYLPLNFCDFGSLIKSGMKRTWAQ